MSAILRFVGSTIGRKILMAVTGFILSGFVLIHMLGNLQFFIGPEAINMYAHHLQTLPAPILWGFRAVILLSVVVHVTMAIWLAHDKASTRPDPYEMKKTLKATFASRTMLIGGIILLAFIVFHILHFTVKVLPSPYAPSEYLVTENGLTYGIPNVYEMMLHGFKTTWISIFYVVGMGALCLHLSHGISSMFQTVGLRNEKWRYPLNALAFIYGLGVFIGFASIPLSVLLGLKG
jgi:succinate dehydrogenase / fumarate reductase cytochrome b subunit